MQPPRKPTLNLLRPAYRRWLTPDMHDLEFEVVGALEQTTLQVRYFVRDTDSDKETQQTTPLTLDGGRFYLPAPKIHHRAELIVFVERTRDREPLVEGRWTIAGVDAERAKELTYFDGRGVPIHNGVGRFPLVASFSDVPPKDAIAQAKAAGYDAVALTKPGAEHLAAAEKSGVLVLVELPFGAPAALQESVRAARNSPAVFGYLLRCDAGAKLAAAVEAYRTVRATDSSRPSLLLPTRVDDWAKPELAGFQDAVVTPVDVRAPELGFRARGCAAFEAAQASADAPADALAAVHVAAARGASGVLLFGIANELTSAPQRELAAALARRIVHSIPDRFGLPAPQHVWMWSRQFDGQRLVGVVNRSAATVEAAVPQPPDGKSWFEWYEPKRSRPLTPEACRLRPGQTLTISTAESPAVGSI